MKPPPFAYVRVEDIPQALSVLAEHGDEARVLAGGQSLIAALNLRLIEPAVLVDISRSPRLGSVHWENDRLTVGAAATQAFVQRLPDIAAKVPLLAKALPHVGHFQSRNKGTVCGSIAHADPAAELPLCLALLDGAVGLASSRGKRTIRAANFFKGPLHTMREADEIITHVTFPISRSGESYAFRKMSIRHGDFAIVAVGARVTDAAIRLGVAGAADRPHVCDWPNLDGGALDDALDGLARQLEFQDDVHANANLRRHLVRTLGRRAVAEARACLI